MTNKMARGAFGDLIEPATLRIERLLPGPAERIWDHLTRGDLRRRWLADGEMDARVGGAFELVWRNDELTSPPGRRPDGFGTEHRMSGTVTECIPLRRLSITWTDTDGVTFDLEPRGAEVLLTVTHRQLPRRTMRVMVGAGWHAHLDILAARLTDAEPQTFWDEWQSLKTEYERRVPAPAA